MFYPCALLARGPVLPHDASSVVNLQRDNLARLLLGHYAEGLGKIFVAGGLADEGENGSQPNH